MILPEREILNGEIVHVTYKKKASLKGDRANICLLMFLYMLQGIPLGLGSAVPMILQSKGVSYSDLAIYSITSWPFSIKLLWAPIVDAVYSKRFGRRKSWLVPAQCLIGMFMLVLSFRVDGWVDHPAGPRIVLLTVFFFVLTVLTATQDVALDGWTLTMLRRENVGYASTCSSVGQSTGFFISFFIFMALESADFCNTYLRSEPLPYGVLTLSSFLNYFGWVFLTTTTCVWLFKKEESPPPDEEPTLGVLETYKLLVRIMQLPAMRTFTVVLLTMGISFSACDTISWLKLVKEGLPREKFAMVTTILVPFKLSIILFFCKYFTGEQPMDMFMKIYPFRVALNVVVAVFICAAPYMLRKDNIPVYFYGLLLVIYGVLEMATGFMHLAKGAFFVRASDPALGSTYMTLMHTFGNLSVSWPSSLVLLLVDHLTFKKCSDDNKNTCSSPELTTTCPGECVTHIDGYYVLIALTTLFGLLWLRWAIPTTRGLQRRDPQDWRVGSRREKKLDHSQFLQ